MIARHLRHLCPLRHGRALLGLLASLAGLSLLLAACGGGVGTGGTGSFASGPITGFGSVIVNGIAFDDGDAAVEDGDGDGRSRGDLRLGMTVEIDADAIAGGRARARRIRFDSALVGPIESIDAAAGRFTMLGQTVTVDDTTVFDERLLGRLALLAPGAVAEVYALYDPALQRFRATRIDARLLPPLFYRLRGVVSQLDAGARTFRIGTAQFSYQGAIGVPSGLENGQFVRLALWPTPAAGGQWRVAAFSAAVRPVDDLDEVVVKGLVSGFSGATTFRVDGRLVDASAAQIEGVPMLGARVEVEGPVRGGVLRASKVKVLSDDDERARGFDLRGAIESVNAAQGTFVLRGITVSTARCRVDPQCYRDGAAADLVTGRNVEVKGLLDSSGTALEATRIKFE